MQCSCECTRLVGRRSSGCAAGASRATHLWACIYHMAHMAHDQFTQSVCCRQQQAAGGGGGAQTSQPRALRSPHTGQGCAACPARIAVSGGWEPRAVTSPPPAGSSGRPSSARLEGALSGGQSGALISQGQSPNGLHSKGAPFQAPRPSWLSPWRCSERRLGVPQLICGE